MVRAPGVVTGRYGTIGEVFLQNVDFWPLNTTLWVSNFHGNDERFVYYLLQRFDFATHSGKSGVPGVNRNDLHTEVVAWPVSRDEQRRIADALDDANQLISSLERLIAKKQAIKKGMMQQLLTGKTRLPGYSKPWRDVQLDSISTVDMGQSPLGASYNTSGKGLPLVQGNADILDRATIDRIWTSSPTKICRAGAVILTVRAPVGYTAIASKDACLGRGVCSISSNLPSDNRFLFHALVHAEREWLVFEQGSTFTAVNSKEVRSFTIPWPTDCDERLAIAEGMDDCNTELAMLQEHLLKARVIKQGMIQELLTGRMHLRPAEVTA